MKRNTFVVIAAVLGSVVSCDTLDDFIGNPGDNGDKEVNFNYRSTIQVGGEGASEISAFCSKTHKLFVVNVEINEISVFDISDVDAPQKLNSITLDGGAPNSVAVSQGKLAVAIEGTVKQDPGTIAVYNTADHSWLGSYPTGALPDMVTFSPNGHYIVSANEGDSREYEGTPGYVGEERIKDIVLDPTAFPDADELQENGNLGRLKIALSEGDPDGDGDYDRLYSYGARSFSIWSGNGQLVYDSGNDIAMKTLELTPENFNSDDGEVDGRSDDKGAEPEAVEVLKIGDAHILFVGLERTNQIMVYDVSNPAAPVFMEILSHGGDLGPEGVLAVSAKDSPTKKELLVVSNEVSGTISIYENE